jgi:hypothetical protein
VEDYRHNPLPSSLEREKEIVDLVDLVDLVKVMEDQREEEV